MEDPHVGQSGRLQDAPLAAVLGRVYQDRTSGTLRVFDRAGSVPFVFWFKRGFPCFSYSRDRISPLGEQLAPPGSPGRRELVENAARRTAATPAGVARPLLGQVLLSESVVSMDELRQGLLRQLARRLLCCAALPDCSFQFDEGLDEFGMVPLSSPLLNPLEAAAKAAMATPFERVRRHVAEELALPSVRLAMDRRIPPVLRSHLSETFLSSLVSPQPVSRLLEVPSHVRTVGVLHAFGFIEQIRQAEPVRREAAPAEESALPGPADRGVLARLYERVRCGASYYELLGVSPVASRAEVKQAYRMLAFAIHPDRVSAKDAGISQEVFAQLVDAYHTLSKERVRTEYDARLVSMGEWQGLGEAGEAAEWLRERHAYLHRIGLTTLASEYERMVFSL